MKKKCHYYWSCRKRFPQLQHLFQRKQELQCRRIYAEQIPGIDGRPYPKELAGADLYPKGIPIFPESQLPELNQEI
jgi:predicted GTPase